MVVSIVSIIICTDCNLSCKLHGTCTHYSSHALLTIVNVCKLSASA